MVIGAGSPVLVEHFRGRDRIWELQEYELTTYLYHLQAASLAPE